MRRNVPFFTVVAGILIILVLLFLQFGHLKHQRERELARLSPGDNEELQVIWLELDEFRMVNENQQRGVLAAGVLVVLIAVVWWVSQRKRHPE